MIHHGILQDRIRDAWDIQVLALTTGALVLEMLIVALDQIDLMSLTGTNQRVRVLSQTK